MGKLLKLYLDYELLTNDQLPFSLAVIFSRTACTNVKVTVWPKKRLSFVNEVSNRTSSKSKYTFFCSL